MNGPLNGADQAIRARLAATDSQMRHIDSQMRHIETLLIGISQLNNRLNQVRGTLEVEVGFLTTGSDMAGVRTEPMSVGGQPNDDNTQFRVIAHLSQDGHAARLVPDAAWSDMCSARLFVTGLLQNMLTPMGCRCWCEVWTPDETGELVDSAYFDPCSGAIDWESDLA